MDRRRIYGTLLVIIVVAVVTGFGYSYPGPRSDNNPGTSVTEEEMVTPVMPPETHELSIPLKSAGRLFLIEAVIDGEKGNLIFDTGASGLVLNKTYFRKHLASPAGQVNGITGSVGQAEKIVAGSLNVSGLRYSKVPATASDLSHIENRRGVKVLGLFGFELLKSFEIELNMPERELILVKTDETGKRTGGLNSRINPDFSVQLTQKNNILFLVAKVSGRELRFCLDSGAEINSIDNHAPKNVIDAIKIERTSSLTGAGSSRREVILGQLNELIIGDVRLKNMPVIIANLDPLSEAYGTKTDGMLGYDFLMKGRIRINFKSGMFTMELNRKEQL